MFESEVTNWYNYFDYDFLLEEKLAFKTKGMLQ